MLRRVIELLPDSPAPLPEPREEEPRRVAVQWLPTEWNARALHVVPSPSDEASPQPEAAAWLPVDGAVPVVTLSHCQEVEPPRWPVDAAHASLIAATGYVRTHRRGVMEGASAAAVLAALALAVAHTESSSPRQLAPAARAHRAALAPAPAVRRAHAVRARHRLGPARPVTGISQRSHSSSFTPVATHKASHVVSASYVVPASHPAMRPSHTRSTSAPLAGIHSPAVVHTHKSPPPPPPTTSSSTSSPPASSGSSSSSNTGGGSNPGPVQQAVNTAVTTAQSVVQKLPPG